MPKSKPYQIRLNTEQREALDRIRRAAAVTLGDATVSRVIAEALDAYAQQLNAGRFPIPERGRPPKEEFDEK